MKTRSIIWLLLASLLSSCVAVIVAGAAAGVIVYDRRSMFTMDSDARIFHQIQKQIVTNPDFNTSRLVVVSFNQVVLLLGQTPASSLRVTAERIAQATPNVRHVHDEITIGQPISFTLRSKDTVITAEVRSQLLTKKGLESGSIRVVTENSVVYLMGIVTQQQANLAVDVARQVRGVQKVVKVFQYFN